MIVILYQHLDMKKLCDAAIRREPTTKTTKMISSAGKATK